MTKAGCYGSETVVDTAGVTRGFLVCEKPGGNGGTMNFIRSSRLGGDWQLSPVPASGLLLAVTDDGAATYVVSSTVDTLWIGKRTRAGAFTTTRVATVEGSVRDATVAASGGRWWVVWSVSNGDCGCFRLYQAKTMGTRQAAHRLAFDGRNPALVATGASSVQMVAMYQDQAEGGNIVVRDARDTTWGAPAYVYGTATEKRFGSGPSIIRTGGVTRVAWRQLRPGSSVVGYADNATGKWVRHTFNTTAGTRADYGFPYLTHSQGRTLVTWTHESTGDHGVAHVAELYRGRWTEASFDDAKTNSSGVIVAGLGSAGGRAQLVVDVDSGSASFTRLRTQ